MTTIDEESELRRLLEPLGAIEPVQRGHRHRGGRRWATVATLAAAAGVAVAAMAATNSWVFSHEHHRVFGTEHLQFHGKPYTVQLQAAGDGRSFFALILSRGDQPTAVPHEGDIVATAGGSSILAEPGVRNPFLLPNPPAPSGPAFGAMNYDEGKGQIWFGDARPEVQRIVITDNHGHVFQTTTSVPPPNIKLAARFWAIALPASTGERIAGYGAHGKLIDQRSIWGLVRAMNLH